MKFEKIRIIIIKKIRDIIFLIIFGRGKFFLLFLKTNVRHLFFSEKFNYDFKNKNFSNKWFFDNVSYIYLFLKKKKKKKKFLFFFWIWKIFGKIFPGRL